MQSFNIMIHWNELSSKRYKGHLFIENRFFNKSKSCNYDDIFFRWFFIRRRDILIPAIWCVRGSISLIFEKISICHYHSWAQGTWRSFVISVRHYNTVMTVSAMLFDVICDCWRQIYDWPVFSYVLLLLLTVDICVIFHMFHRLAQCRHWSRNIKKKNHECEHVRKIDKSERRLKIVIYWKNLVN